MKSSVSLGQESELIAQKYLEQQGLRLVAKNFKPKGGEIDLIMQQDEYYVFVEVKMRTAQDFGTTLEVFSPFQQSRIIRTAKQFLLENDLYDRVDTRFDLIGVSKNGQQIDWIQNAFEVQY